LTDDLLLNTYQNFTTKFLYFVFIKTEYYNGTKNSKLHRSCGKWFSQLNSFTYI